MTTFLMEKQEICGKMKVVIKMAKIHIMDEILANKIAAGDVVVLL